MCQIPSRPLVMQRIKWPADGCGLAYETRSPRLEPRAGGRARVKVRVPLGPRVVGKSVTIGVVQTI